MSSIPSAQRTLGLLLGFGAGAGLGLYTIFIKQVSGEHPLPALMLAMFLGASLCSVPGYAWHLSRQWRSGELRPQLRGSSSMLMLALTLSLLLGNFLISHALQFAAPALVHVIHRVELIFTAIFATLFLRESLNRWTLIAIVLVFLGVALMRWGDGVASSGVSWLVLLLVVGSSACFAIAPIFSKLLLRQGYSPQSINSLRLFGNCVILALLPATFQQFLALPFEAMLYAALAGCCGPCFGRLCHTYAIKFIDVSSVSLVAMSATVLTFVVQFFVYALVPSWSELFGAVVVTFAVALTVLMTYRKPYA